MVTSTLKAVEFQVLRPIQLYIKILLFLVTSNVGICARAASRALRAGFVRHGRICVDSRFIYEFVFETLPIPLCIPYPIRFANDQPHLIHAHQNPQLLQDIHSHD